MKRKHIIARHLNKHSNFRIQVIMAIDFLNIEVKKYEKNPDKAADIVQDTIEKALTKESEYQEQNNVKGWLFVIMKNMVIDSQRKGNKRRTLEIERADREEIETPHFELDFVTPSIGLIQDRGTREILIMLGQGYDRKQIAEQTGLSLSSVNRKIHQGRDNLKAILKLKMQDDLI